MTEDVLPATEIMRRFMEDAWVNRDADACSRHLTDDFRHFMPDSEEPQVGPAAYQEIITSFLQGLPELTMTIEDLFGEGNRVCIRWRARGVHQGNFGGVRGTGNSLDLRGVGIGTSRDGKLCESISVFGTQSLTRTLQGG